MTPVIRARSCATWARAGLTLAGWVLIVGFCLVVWDVVIGMATNG